MAPEPKTSLARITPPARQATRTIATTLSSPSPRRRPRAELPALKAIAAREGAERRREAEPVGEDEAGEGGGADGVREEGEAAQDYPGAEQAGRHGEDEDLDQAALDEGELEGLEQAGPSIVRMSLVCRKTGGLRSAAVVLGSRPYGERWAPLLFTLSRRWSAQRSSASNDSPVAGEDGEAERGAGSRGA